MKAGATVEGVDVEVAGWLADNHMRDVLGVSTGEPSASKGRLQLKWARAWAGERELGGVEKGDESQETRRLLLLGAGVGTRLSSVVTPPGCSVASSRSSRSKDSLRGWLASTACEK
jgi:hypothetical protein